MEAAWLPLDRSEGSPTPTHSQTGQTPDTNQARSQDEPKPQLNFTSRLISEMSFSVIVEYSYSYSGYLCAVETGK